jgi:hypothetical protein
MSNVPHPVPSRIAHLTAELYGQADDHLLAWQHTCAQVSDALRAHHASERLGKALALAQGGAVELDSDGFAVVTSGTQLYHVQADGRCDCPDYAQRSAPCKHVLAVLIHTKAHELLAPSASAAHEPAPTPKRPARSRSSATAAPAPAVPTSAAWQVQEAPTSACFKWRIGQAELTYTFRGATDAEVLARFRETLPLLHDILDACQTRADERAAARDAALAQAHAPQTPAPTDVHALIQQAVQQALAALSPSHTAPNGHANGHTPASPPRCPSHGAMRESTKAPGTWFCTQKLPDGAYCTHKA